GSRTVPLRGEILSILFGARNFPAPRPGRRRLLDASGGPVAAAATAAGAHPPPQRPPGRLRSPRTLTWAEPDRRPAAVASRRSDTPRRQPPPHTPAPTPPDPTRSLTRGR